jgi:hypothetical protein
MKARFSLAYINSESLNTLNLLNMYDIVLTCRVPVAHRIAPCKAPVVKGT